MLVNQLALKVARGEAWMGFPVVRPGRVLLIDNELHPETSANRLAKVAEAEKYEISTVHENLKVLNLRGELMDFYQLDENFMQHQNAGDFTLIILDAFYRFLPAGTDENDNGSMARIYNLLDSWATRLNCAFVCIHHSSKGSQAEKQVSDVGSGAGSMSRAADAHIVLRPHKEPGHVVMEALVRSWKPMDPRVLGFSYPKFTLAPHLDPADLARPGKRATEDGWSPQRFVDECWKVDVLPWASVQTIATDVHGIGKARALELREQAQGRGLIYKVGSGAGTLWARKAVAVCDVLKSE
jgi:hypothetical protein